MTGEQGCPSAFTYLQSKRAFWKRMLIRENLCPVVLEMTLVGL